MGKREAEIKITGNTDDAKASIKDLERATKKSFDKMSEAAEKEAKEIEEAFKKTGIRMESDIKKSSEDARKRYEKIKNSGTASANDIKRAHTAMTTKIKRNNRELSTSSAKANRLFDKLKTGIIAASAAAVGFFGLKSIREAIDFERSLLELQKVLNDTEGDAKQYTGQIEELSKRYGEAQSEILKGVATFRQAGFVISESFLLQESAMKLAAISELEVVEASELIVSSLKGFKAPASESARLIDVLNEVSNNYATNLRELAIGVAEISPIAKKMNFSFEETAGIITPVIEVFRSGSEAAQALKTGLLKLIDDSAPVTTALKKMGVEQKDFNGNMRSGRDILFDVAERFKTLEPNMKLVQTAQIVGIRQAAKMVEVFDGLSLALEITDKGMKSFGSANKETAIFLSSTAAKGKKASQVFSIMAKAIGNILLPVWNKLLDIAIPGMEILTKEINLMADSLRLIAKVGGFIIDPFKNLNIFGKTKEEIKAVKEETERLKQVTEAATAANKKQAESVKQVTEALIDTAAIRKQEKALIDKNRDAVIAALKATDTIQRATNDSLRESIQNTKKELRGLEYEAAKAAKFVRRLLGEIAGSEKIRAQADLDPLEKLLDDLERAEADFKKAATERTAGNVDQARELTLSAVQAANAILEVQKGADVGSEVGRAELERATREAEKLVKQARLFAEEMDTAATAAIPAVQEKLKSLENDLATGKATLDGIREGIAAAKSEATDLKSKLNEDTTSTHTQIINTVNTGGNGGPGFNVGGPIPGYGGGDRHPIMTEGGEHVIRKEAVKKLGRPAAVAFNRGDIAGLISALPVQKFQEGGEVQSMGATANVNLIMGEKSFPVTAEASVATEFIEEIKFMNTIRGRKETKY